MAVCQADEIRLDTLPDWDEGSWLRSHLSPWKSTVDSILGADVQTMPTHLNQRYGISCTLSGIYKRRMCSEKVFTSHILQSSFLKPDASEEIRWRRNIK